MVKVVEDIFGKAINPLTKNLDIIKRYTLTNGMKMSVQIITLGATVTAIKVPDAYGHVEDIVAGYDDVAGYQDDTNPYLGSTIGRVCNRIRDGCFTLNGQEFHVSCNFNNKHHLHGGFIGYNKIHWRLLQLHNDGITLQHNSKDGHEGYPGHVTSFVIYKLTEDNCLHISMQAIIDETTTNANMKSSIINMTNHAYFNLAGHTAGKTSIYDHIIMIKADKITETDDDSIPTGRFIDVKDTNYDLTKPTKLGDRLQQLNNGFDNNFCVQLENDQDTTIVARVYHPLSGRCLEIASNQPGIQFYTSNYFPDPTKGEAPLLGKDGARYVRQGFFCLETQKYPDAINHPHFPSIVLNSGETYKHDVIYKFGIVHSTADIIQ